MNATHSRNISFIIIPINIPDFYFLSCNRYTVFQNISRTSSLFNLTLVHLLIAGKGSHAYSPIVIGLYLDQIVRRVDPQKRGLGEYFRAEISEPFGI